MGLGLGSGLGSPKARGGGGLGLVLVLALVLESLPTHQCPPPQPCTSLRSQVVSDDCTPVYWQQPGCTQVIEGMQRLGYRPVSDTPCTPPHPRLRPSHW